MERARTLNRATHTWRVPHSTLHRLWDAPSGQLLGSVERVSGTTSEDFLYQVFLTEPRTSDRDPKSSIGYFMSFESAKTALMDIVYGPDDLLWWRD